MTQISDVARRARRQWWLAVAGGVGAVALVATWACWPLSVATKPLHLADRLPEPHRATAITAPAWDVRLWQPFTDEPVVNKAPPPPLKLYSILKRGGVFIAALGGDEAPMVYASVGDVVQGVTIRGIDAAGVDVHSAMGDQRLELRP
jgi:hypothetical protein